MPVSYNRLWKILEERNINKKTLCEMSGVSSVSMAKMGKNESVSIEVLCKICKALNCTFDDIIKNVGDDVPIIPIPDIDFIECIDENDDAYFYDWDDELKILGLERFADFPKPYTIESIKNTLTKYVQEYKMSVDLCNAIVEILKQNDIIIEFEESPIPDETKVPKYFYTNNEELPLYKLQYLQIENYLASKMEKYNVPEIRSLILEVVKNISNEEQIINNDNINMEADYIGLNIIYKTAVPELITRKAPYPINLLYDIFGYENYYYNRNQFLDICNIFNAVVNTLTQLEQMLICILYRYNLKIDSLFKILGLQNYDTVKTVFKNKYIRRILRKLKHPKRSNKIKEYLYDRKNFNIIQLNQCEWKWSDIFFNKDIENQLKSLINYDVVLCSFISDKTEMNTYVVISEMLISSNIEYHIFSVDINNSVTLINKKVDNLSWTFGKIKDCKVEPYTEQKSIDSLNFSMRTQKVLKDAGLFTINDIASKTINDLMCIKNLGKKSFIEIQEKLIENQYIITENGKIEKTKCNKKDKMLAFAQYYRELYSRNDIKTERLLCDGFMEKCFEFGFKMDTGASFMNAFPDSNALKNSNFLIEDLKSINDVQIFGSAIFSKWRYVTHWSSDSLLSQDNRIWFVTAFDKLISLVELTNQKEKQEEPLQLKIDDSFLISLDDLDLSVRSYNCLRRAGIIYIEDLLNKTEDDLMKIRNLNSKYVEEIIQKMHSLGFTDWPKSFEDA